MIFGVGHHMLVFEDGMVSDGAISVQNMRHAEQSAWKGLTYNLWQCLACFPFFNNPRQRDLDV